MPSYIDVVETGKFWQALNSDIFSLPVVAVALEIGRNKMNQIPVVRIMIDKRAFYQKGAILDWALSDEGKDLLNKLKEQKSSISKAAKMRSLVYDQYYTKSNESHYRPSNGKRESKKDKYTRLCHEWGTRWSSRQNESIGRQLSDCYDDEKLKRLIAIAWSIREQFVELRMGLPRGMELGNWWFAEDFESVLRARKESDRAELRWKIKFEQEDLDSAELLQFAKANGWDYEEYVKEKKKEIDLLKARLKDLS